jgi:PEGA domain
VVPSLDQSTSESYVWAHPGCPVRILLSLNVIEQLQAEVSQTAAWRGEIGGLLIRSKRSKSGTIKIVDFIPLPGERRTSDLHFKLPAESLAEAIARCPSDCKIAGYYRTDVDQSVRLRPEDLETIQQWFKDPASVFLLISAADGSRSTAGFFFWENDSVAANSSLTFPFGAAKLVSEGWPTQADPVEKEKFATFAGVFRKTTDLVRRTSVPMKIGMVSALFALIIGIRLFTWNRSATHSTVIASPSLGLQVRREGTKFLVAWNPSAPAITNAKDANLVIWDASRETWDGSSDPLYMPLTPAQLRSGNVTYTSFFLTEKVKFRLDTIGSSGDAASESMVSISPLSITNPAPSAARPPAPPAVEGPPPYEPRRSTVTSTLPDRPALPVVRQPAVRSSRPANKKFVPPRSAPTVKVARETAMPDPPNLAAELAARAPSSINPGFNPNAVAALGPPAAQTDTGSPGTRGASVAPPNGQSNPGVVTITSEPSGARVEINAIPAGVTPITLQISPVGLGFTVTVTKSGFMKWTVQSISTSQPYSMHAQLRQIPK